MRGSVPESPEGEQGSGPPGSKGRTDRCLRCHSVRGYHGESGVDGKCPVAGVLAPRHRSSGGKDPAEGRGRTGDTRKVTGVVPESPTWTMHPYRTVRTCRWNHPRTVLGTGRRTPLSRERDGSFGGWDVMSTPVCRVEWVGSRVPPVSGVLVSRRPLYPWYDLSPRRGKCRVVHDN